uniref:G-type lectin S-receptor-like serine/threonine-protein kinase At4g27290 isoform X2 n=1 Tax=Erigeron canadensis TaxID=72917 RepID=UPI001CB977DE|nr:G-type lectin S-receptor-like serine/threonine-protein kinase At4g27290 isoform X2 [Erigeron canadensis]
MMLPFRITFFLILLGTCSSLDTISVNQNITDNGQTLVSNNGIYEMGFFSPGSTPNRHLSIWFRNTSPLRAVWVANRQSAVLDKSGVVRLDSQGSLSLYYGRETMWSSNSSRLGTNFSPIAQLLDTGNLVIRDMNNNTEPFIWQSFDHPGDTYIPGMKLGKNFLTGKETYLTSWWSIDDPSPGDCSLSYSMDTVNFTQLYIKKSSVVETRIGPYNGREFAGQPSLYKLDIVVDPNEMYYNFTSNSTIFSLRLVTGSDCKLYTHSQELTQDLTFPVDSCDNYATCGPFGSCSAANNPICGCLKGFEPQDTYNRTSGCRRSRALDCGSDEGFQKFLDMKLPDTQNAVYNKSMTLQECEVACKNNCSCTAYANPNITAGGFGCLRWFGDLIDIRVYPQNGQDLYVRLAASEFSDQHSSSHRKKRVVITVAVSISAGLTLMFLIFTLYIRSRRRKILDAYRKGGHEKTLDKAYKGNRSQKGSVEVPFFSLSDLCKATNDFSDDNKLGEGGFGPVYKGVLEEGQQIAVKRLSKSSRQGLDEFENEVLCIAKLQHRNLVKLLGYCIEGDETMLIYEYMPNNSLDSFIFDESRKLLLDWPQRFLIIHGIARGLLYLHQDSRLTVVHRDLKAGNILLDHQMRPKISDFGLARMFKEHENEANTKRVVGTLGYISPEYAVNGLFSVKSDIFSFGVLVLEIVSGQKTRGFVHEKHGDNLLGHAWRLFKEGKSLDLVDECLCKSYSVYEVLRSIHVALLCVQQQAKDRPSTSSVVAMLNGKGSLPSPKQPGFFIQGSEIGSSSSVPSLSSINGVTMSQVDGR